MHDAVIGFIGRKKPLQDMALWRAYATSCGRSVHVDFYRTDTSDLLLRLSELFVLDRRGYIVSRELQQDIIPLLDALHPSAQQWSRVDAVHNDGGVLRGYFVQSDSMSDRWSVLLHE